MSIFLRQLYKEPPRIWGSFQDRQYSIWRNLEDIYGVDHKSEVLIMPLFWGLPPLDYSGFNNHGINHGAIYKDGVLDFDGTNDFVYHGTSACNMGTDDFTASGWIKINELLSTHKGILGKWGSDNYYYVSIGETNKLSGIINCGSGNVLSESNSAITTDWVYFAYVVDRSGSTALYINGVVQSDTDDISADSANSISNNNGFAIGRIGHNLAGWNFDGSIGEIRIAKAVYTVKQIALFHDRPWDLYRSVSRPVYFLPIYIQKLIEGKYDLLLQKTGEAKYDILAQKITEAKYDILLQKLNEVKYDILLQETVEAKYDILFQKAVESLYDIIVQKIVESKYDIHTQKTAEAIYDILLQTITEAKYDILLILKTIEMQSIIQSTVNLDSEIQTIINFQSTIKPVINLKSYIEE